MAPSSKWRDSISIMEWSYEWGNERYKERRESKSVNTILNEEIFVREWWSKDYKQDQ